MIRFGTGGWRAFIGEEFTRDNVRIVSQAIAQLMKCMKAQENGFVIGFDRRFLSDKAAVWMSEVMAGNGIKVYFIRKVSPTPLVMFTVKKMRACLGAAVTASHNPADYNGIKVFTEGGRDATELVTGRIESLADGLNPQSIEAVSFDEGVNNGLIKFIDPFDDYIDAIIGMIDIEAIRGKKLKVLLDPMHGVSRTSLQTILITGRCEVDIINDRHDTLFGGRLPSPNTQTLQRLRELVILGKYDIGVGTDGDADRLGIIDEKGSFIHPNKILAMLYYYLLKYKGWKGGAVRNVATTHLLDRIAAGFGEECHEVPVGFKHISAMMEEKNALIGGESSGGLTIRGHIKGKDGIFAASLIIELLSVTGQTVSGMLDEISREYGNFYADEMDLMLDDHKKREIFKVLFDDRRIPDFGLKIAEVSYMDGLKIAFENGGWVVARFSGTEPLLRIFSEMSNEADAADVNLKMKEFLLS